MIFIMFSINLLILLHVHIVLNKIDFSSGEQRTAMTFCPLSVVGRRYFFFRREHFQIDPSFDGPLS